METIGTFTIGCRIVYENNISLVFNIEKNNNICYEGPHGLNVFKPEILRNINYLIKKEKSREINGKNNEM